MRALILAAAMGALASTSLLAAAPNPAPATLHVVLPQSAVLTINGARTQSTSSDRWFVTPALEPGKTYVCTLEAKFVRDGREVRIERKVAVRAGSEQRVNMDVPVSSNAVYRSSYDGSVPPPPVAAPALPAAGERQHNFTDNGD